MGPGMTTSSLLLSPEYVIHSSMLNVLSPAMELFLAKGLILAILVCSSAAQLLPGDEVEALRTISSRLHNSYWNLSQSSCSNGFNMTLTPGDIGSIGSFVTCDCSFVNYTVCHVTNITLKGLNLTGTLADEFVNLTHLRNIDLSWNYLNGTIPAKFGQLGLITLSLLGNRFSGTIPEALGGIATLEELILDDNLLEGNLPESLGRLGDLRKLRLSANNFNGTIPKTYANLMKLTDFRIDGSNLSGRVPKFIGNWTSLDRLDLQGTGMEGPIPATISQLKNLTQLRISSLGGQNSTFPNLQDMTAMSQLILRNCSITGPIPLYIGSNMTQLIFLDLSFNKLIGKVPPTFNFQTLHYMFMSHNLLTGEVPGSIPSSGNIDLSNNNFNHSCTISCQFSDINLISSQPASAPTSSWCMIQGLPCPRQANYNSVFINCGGRQTTFEGHEYEENFSESSSSHFESNNRWAYSNTGTYMDTSWWRFRTQNDSLMKDDDSNASIYETCRVSPSSMKFYGLCLSRGSYTVRLYFAEIMFNDTSSFSSIGRRIFDVSIQDRVVLTNFDITREANGVRRGIYREFKNVEVKRSTLEIHLYWTGKGTTAIPSAGVHGPLISAISITQNGSSSSVWVIVGVILSLCVVILLVWVRLYKGGYIEKNDNELRGLNIGTRYFSLKQIKSATNNFDSANKIGEGGFGIVYRGVLPDGTVIAVKKLSSASNQGTREFVNEIGMISALNHPNLVKLFGCCVQGNQLFLIYEYLENNCLARALFGSEKERTKLVWPIRKKICIGIAKGLMHLHEESMLKIVHRDIKATNVLLDEDLNAKISDFGVAKLDEGDNTHMSTRVAGTIGYMAPEYALKGHLTAKADVYSFGVVLLEIICGKSNTRYRPKEEDHNHLLDWANVYQRQGNLLDLVDPCLGTNYPKKEALEMLHLSLLCTNPCERGRPLMSEVVSMLEGKTKVPQPLLVERGSTSKDAVLRNTALEALLHDSKSSTRRSDSMDVPWVDSSQDDESLILCQSLSPESYYQHFISEGESNV